jgi:hypothetical protein
MLISTLCARSLKLIIRENTSNFIKTFQDIFKILIFRKMLKNFRFFENFAVAYSIKNLGHHSLHLDYVTFVHSVLFGAFRFDNIARYRKRKI